VICAQVVKNPKECTSCGNMFCASCIDAWILKKKECPNRCPINNSSIQSIGRALMRIYNDLDVKCKFYVQCKQIVKLIDLDKHEKVCQLPKCANYDVCQNFVKPEYKTQGVCEPTCLLLKKIKDANSNWTIVYADIKEFIKNYSPMVVNSNSIPAQISAGPSNNADGVTTFRWDTVNIGTGIETSNNRQNAFLREGPYMFRTVIGDTGMNGGIHYWEIYADERTENELKIGVTTKKDFNMNSAFCDYEYGYSFYGLGQLRHNSNASGPQYGKRFKKEGVLGVFLDMNRGILSFALNGEYFGPAYTHDNLKKGPIYAAISLLHCAGCRLENGKKAPAYFLGN